MKRCNVALASLILAFPSLAQSQAGPGAAALISAQRESLRAFARMDGVWRGSAWTLLPSGERHTITQTERIGPFLDGSVKVIEGRGYEADGSVSFNALGIVSYDPAKKAYNLRSYALGRSGDFVITPTANGYMWEIPAGPATIRYTAVITNGRLREIGERIIPGAAPVQFFEMNLRRIGSSTWPAGSAVPSR